MQRQTAASWFPLLKVIADLPGPVAWRSATHRNRRCTTSPLPIKWGQLVSEPAKRTPIWASWRGLLALCSVAPHQSRQPAKEYKRVNGPYHALHAIAVGRQQTALWQSSPPMLLAWVCDRSGTDPKSRELVLGRSSLSKFMRHPGNQQHSSRGAFAGNKPGSAIK